MKLAGVIVLNGARVAVDIEVDDDAIAPRSPYLDDAALRARWHCSARTLSRIRDGRALTFTAPRGKFLYALADVEAFEAQQRTEARPRVRVARRST